MRNWLIKLLGGYTVPPAAPANPVSGEYQAGFSDGHQVGFKSGEIAEGRRQMDKAMNIEIPKINKRAVLESFLAIQGVPKKVIIRKRKSKKKKK